MLSRRGHAARGFTLIELAVSLTVLGLLMMAVMPSVGVWIRNTQIRNVASSMQAGLQVARNEAIRRNAAVRFSLVSLTDSAVMDNSCALSSGGVSWVVSVRDPSTYCAYLPSNVAADANDPMIVESNAGGVGGRNVVVEAKLEDLSVAGTTVTFNGFGRVEDVAPIRFINVGSDTPGSDYRSLRIEVSPGGSVRLCDRAVSVTTDSRHCPTTVSHEP
jgi:type IV fimbrial biogenesis protein FimT